MRAHLERRWPLLIVLAALQALGFANRFLLALLATPIELSLGMDDFHMGLLQGTAFIVPFVAFTPVFGVWVDRSGVSSPLMAGLALMWLAMGICAVATGFDTFLAARALLGAGEAAIAPVALVEIARGASREGLGTAMFAAGGPIGKGLALTGGGALLALFTRTAGALAPWREVMWVAVALNLLALVAMAWRAREPRRSARAAASRYGAGPVEGGSRGYGLWLLTAAGASAVLASQTVAFWAPRLFMHSFGLTAARAGSMLGAPLLVMVPGVGLLVGWGLDRAGERPGRHSPVATALAVFLAAAAAAVLALRTSGEYERALLAFCLLTSLLAAAAICALRGVQLNAPDGARGRVMGAYVAVANLIGFGLGPPLVGLFSPSMGLADALAAVLACACLIGAASALPLLLRPPPALQELT